MEVRKQWIIAWGKNWESWISFEDFNAKVNKK